jgi:hypothetical protein
MTAEILMLSSEYLTDPKLKEVGVSEFLFPYGFRSLRKPNAPENCFCVFSDALLSEYNLSSILEQVTSGT